MARPVQRDLFVDRIGDGLDLRLDAGEAVSLTIERVQDFGEADGTRFSVFLTGPGDQLLAQGIYRAGPGDGGPFDLFLVPVGREGDRFVYEAAFNRDGS